MNIKEDFDMLRFTAPRLLYGIITAFVILNITYYVVGVITVYNYLDDTGIVNVYTKNIPWRSLEMFFTWICTFAWCSFITVPIFIASKYITRIIKAIAKFIVKHSEKE